MYLLIIYNLLSVAHPHSRVRVSVFDLVHSFSFLNTCVVSGAQSGPGLLQCVLQSHVHAGLQRVQRLRGHSARCVPRGDGKTDRLRLHVPHHHGREVCATSSSCCYEVSILKQCSGVLKTDWKQVKVCVRAFSKRSVFCEGFRWRTRPKPVAISSPNTWSRRTSSASPALQRRSAARSCIRRAERTSVHTSVR